MVQKKSRARVMVQKKKEKNIRFASRNRCQPSRKTQNRFFGGAAYQMADSFPKYYLLASLTGAWCTQLGYGDKISDILGPQLRSYHLRDSQAFKISVVGGVVC